MSTDNARKMSQSTDEAVRPVSANPGLPSRHLPYTTLLQAKSGLSFRDCLCTLVWSARNGGPSARIVRQKKWKRIGKKSKQVTDNK